MIARSPFVKGLSLILAATVVAGAVQWGVSRTTIELEGSGTPAVSALSSAVPVVRNVATALRL